MNKYDSIAVGEKAELTHVITQSDVKHFVDLTGDDNKLHVDREFASKTSFKKPVAHGMLGASFISTVIGTKLPGDGALWYSQNLEFLLPVRVGDTITVRAEVIKKIDRMQAIELSTDIYNQNKQKVVTGTARVKIVDQVEPQKTEERKNKKRIAVVIGGSGGIGQAACLRLARDGFDIAVHYLGNKEKADELAGKITTMGRRAISVRADITDYEDVKSMVDLICRKLGPVTVLVNSSLSGLPNIKFSDLDWESIQHQIDVNVKGLHNLAKCIVPVMEKEKYGKVINLTTQDIDEPKTELIHYIAAKSALQGYSRALAVELGPKGIRVNLVSPGMTETGLVANFPEKVRLLTAARAPLRRIAQPEDVANAVSFLASEDSDYLTGETIRVNGGQVMK
ncbi:MAG: SDR family oxidoreductase [Nitrospirae bacterium]|nr:SDR family oxidoreductase [Nitrospirota bacterium]